MSFSMKLPAAKSSKKQYGLILPASKKDTKPAFNAFDAAASTSSSSKSTDGASSDAAAALRRKVGEDAARSVQREQVARTHEEALAQDPSVFDYDGVYDEIDRTRQDKATQRRAQREAEKRAPKYIATLMEKAKIREIENERIRERRLLNERKAEDALYGDKEKLISASYKRKLLEKEKWDAEDARLDAIEDAEDVTKRGEHALAGFYANLLSKNIAMGGSTANARSAYTVKDAGVSGQSKHDDDGDDGGSSSERVHEPSEKRRRRDDDAPSASSSRDAREFAAVSTPPASQSAAAAVVAPAPAVTAAAATVEVKASKDDVISAAKARFLARKALREQQQQ